MLKNVDNAGQAIAPTTSSHHGSRAILDSRKRPDAERVVQRLQHFILCHSLTPADDETIYYNKRYVWAKLFTHVIHERGKNTVRNRHEGRNRECENKNA